MNSFWVLMFSGPWNRDLDSWRRVPDSAFGPLVPNPSSRIPECTCRFSIKSRSRWPIHVLNLVHIRLALNLIAYLDSWSGSRDPGPGNTRTPDSGSRTPGCPRSRISESTCRFSINKIEPRVDICQIVTYSCLNLVHVYFWIQVIAAIRCICVPVRKLETGTWTPVWRLRVQQTPGPDRLFTTQQWVGSI